MTRATPLYYIFHGEDVFSLREEARTLRNRMKSDDMGDLNTAVYDGRSAPVGEIIGAVSMLPFMTDKRLVVVENLLTWLTRKSAGKTGKAEMERLVEALPNLPETARLAFVEFEPLKETHPVLKLAQQSGSRAFIKECAVPRDLGRWITRQVEFYGGRIEPRAAAALAESLADLDLYAADSECAKLVTYVGSERAITEADVSTLTPYVPQARIFDIVDAIGQGKQKQALTLIYRLLEDPKENTLALLSMITRQFRLLIITREVLDRGGNLRDVPELQRLPINKFIEQANRFRLQQLEGIYRTLFETDYAIKSGRMKDYLALDLFVASLG